MQYKVTVYDVSSGNGEGTPIWETIVLPPLVHRDDAVGAARRALGDLQHFTALGGPLHPDVELDIRVRRIGPPRGEFR